MTAMRYTLGEASRATGKSKTAITNAIKRGDISELPRNSKGHLQLDPSEVHRVYPRVSQQNTKKDDQEPQEKQSKFRNFIELEMGLKLAHERIADKDARIEELKDERDDWKGQAKQLALDFHPTPEHVAPHHRSEPKQGRGLFSWFKKG